MPELPRRMFLRATACAAACLLPKLASADDYPARPVHWINGFAPGGAPDVIARLLAQWLSQQLGQNFIVVNRPGAGTNIATEAVVHAPADGYTLLMVTSPNMINAALYPNLSFNFLRDIVPVATIGRNPFVMVTNPAFPAKTVAEFIAYAKANPGKVNVASTGTGNLTYFAGELFKMMAGIDIVSVPSGSEMQAQSDLLAGRAQVMFDPIVSSLGHIKAGKMRALGITSAAPLPTLPEVPTIGATVPGYAVDGWIGLGAPSGTPNEIIATLNKAVGDGLADPGIKTRLVNFGFVPEATTPAAFGKFIADETAKWAKVVKFAGVKLN